MIALVLAAATFAQARNIVLPAISVPRYVRVILPQAIDGGPDATYADLRVLDTAGHDVPYALDPSRTQTAQPLHVSDVGFVPGQYTQAIVDYGTSGAEHDAVTLETSRTTYFERVKLQTSDDRQTWASIQSDGLIYAVAQPHDDGSQTVTYPPTHARYLRIRIMDGERAFPVTGAASAAAAQQPVLYTITHHDVVSQDGNDTVIAVDTDADDADISGIAITTTTREFSRSVSVSAKGTQTDQPVQSASGTFSRYANGTPAMSLDVPLHTRRFEVRIANGNDRPLANLQLIVYGHQHSIVFNADPKSAYRLAWGAQLDAPSYDLGDRLSHESWSAANATLGASASTAAALESGQDAGALLRRYAIPVALVIALAALALVVFSTLRAKPAQ